MSRKLENKEHLRNSLFAILIILLSKSKSWNIFCVKTIIFKYVCRYNLLWNTFAYNIFPLIWNNVHLYAAALPPLACELLDILVTQCTCTTVSAIYMCATILIMLRKCCVHTLICLTLLNQNTILLLETRNESCSCETLNHPLFLIRRWLLATWS